MSVLFIQAIKDTLRIEKVLSKRRRLCFTLVDKETATDNFQAKIKVVSIKNVSVLFISNKGHSPDRESLSKGDASVFHIDKETTTDNTTSIFRNTLLK